MFVLSASQRRFCEMTYQDVERLIYHTVHKFRARYGGDFDELLSVANFCFIDVYQKPYDSEKAKFSSWLRLKIWYALLSDRRTRAISAAREQPCDMAEMPENLFACEDDQGKWDLSEDADMLLRAALRKQTRGWSKLMDVALDDRAWSIERLARGWKEVQEALV